MAYKLVYVSAVVAKAAIPSLIGGGVVLPYAQRNACGTVDSVVWSSDDGVDFDAGALIIEVNFAGFLSARVLDKEFAVGDVDVGKTRTVGKSFCCVRNGFYWWFINGRRIAFR